MSFLLPPVVFFLFFDPPPLSLLFSLTSLLRLSPKSFIFLFLFSSPLVLFSPSSVLFLSLSFLFFNSPPIFFCLSLSSQLCTVISGFPPAAIFRPVCYYIIYILKLQYTQIPLFFFFIMKNKRETHSNTGYRYTCNTLIKMPGSSQ